MFLTLNIHVHPIDDVQALILAKSHSGPHSISLRVAGIVSSPLKSQDTQTPPADLAADISRYSTQ